MPIDRSCGIDAQRQVAFVSGASGVAGEIHRTVAGCAAIEDGVAVAHDGLEQDKLKRLAGFTLVRRDRRGDVKMHDRSGRDGAECRVCCSCRECGAEKQECGGDQAERSRRKMRVYRDNHGGNVEAIRARSSCIL